MNLFYFKYTAFPCAQIHEQSLSVQAVAVPVVGGPSDSVHQSPGPAAEVLEGQPDIALALVVGVIHDDQQTLPIGALPGERSEAIAGPVPVPGGHALQQLP